MTDSIQDTDGARAVSRQPIIAWTFLAILIGAAVAIGVAILLGDEISTLEDYRTRGAQYAEMMDLVLILALCVVISLAVWGLFLVLVFSKRAALWKSLVALLAVLVVTTLAGVIARAGTLVHYTNEDERALTEIRSALNQRLRDMRSASEREGRALRADRGLPEFRSHADIANALTAIRERRRHIQEFEAAADAEIERTKREMLALDVFEGERVRFIEQLDEILAPSSATHRLFDLENALLDKQEEAVTFLLEHRSSWSFYEGSLAFHDRADLNRMNEIMREAYAIIPQIDALEGAGGQGVPRTVAEPPV